MENENNIINNESILDSNVINNENITEVDTVEEITGIDTVEEITMDTNATIVETEEVEDNTVLNKDSDDQNNVLEEIVVLESINESNEETVNTIRPKEDEYKLGEVIPAHLNIRKSPDKSSDIIGIVNQGDEIKILGEVDTFYKISYLGIEAYCIKEFIIIK